MTIVPTAFNFVMNFIGVTCFIIVALFVLLAYFQPTELDALVHHAHLGVHDFVSYVIHSIKTNL